MSDDQTLLFANAAFYAAFADGDANLMGRVWSATRPVACIHPGWETLTGREAVMASWRAILQNPPPIEVLNPQPVVIAPGAAGLVLCNERVGGSLLAATNVFVHEGGGWKLVHHQAGPTPDDGQDQPSTTEQMH
ncbi:MAG: DUF4440 domain-containing protein [Alphaproteobacteria bacterium]|jgi:hypothetical protein|nr:DUF4440 domain-containing protein [Alphaproteobacteria bacterium]